jgi:hypothetical protein
MPQFIDTTDFGILTQFRGAWLAGMGEVILNNSTLGKHDEKDCDVRR